MAISMLIIFTLSKVNSRMIRLKGDILDAKIVYLDNAKKTEGTYQKNKQKTNGC